MFAGLFSSKKNFWILRKTHRQEGAFRVETVAESAENRLSSEFLQRIDLSKIYCYFPDYYFRLLLAFLVLIPSI